MQDRVDEIVEFTLPGLEERTALLNQYFDMYVAIPMPASKSLFGGNAAKKIDVVGDFDVEAKLATYANNSRLSLVAKSRSWALRSKRRHMVLRRVN